MSFPELIKVLLIEDLISDAELAKRELRKSGLHTEIKHVDNKRDYEAALSEFCPDIILTDYNLPQFTGLEALRIKQEKCPDIPLIILTGSMNEETAVECMKSGADDYVIKEHITRLPMAVLSVIENNNQRILRNKAEIAREKAYNDWVNIFQSISNPAIILNPQFEIIEANKTTLEKTGLTLDEIRGRKCHEIFHDKTISCITGCPAKEIIDEKIDKTTEFEIETLGGHYLISCKPVFDENGNIEKIIHISTDITQLLNIKKQQEELLEERSKILKRLNLQIETMPNGLMIIDMEYNIVDWNPAAERILGYSKQEATGKNVINLIVPETISDRVISKFIECLTEKKNVFGLNENLTKSGKTIVCEWHNAPLIDESGNPFGYMLMFNDITDTVKSEKARDAVYTISELVHSTVNLDELFSKIYTVIQGLMPAKNFYIALLDEDQVSMNFPYWVDTYDPPPANKRLGKGLTEYVLRSCKPLFANTEIIEELEIKGEIEFLGRPSVEWLGVPLIIRNKPFGVLVVQNYEEDILYGDDEKDLLLFVSNQIASAIDNKIKEQELIVARDKAEESSKLKSSLLANLSHELRTPMNGILGFAELLNDFVEDESLKVMSENILHSGIRLMKTLESVMTLTELQAETFILNISEFELNRLFEDIMANFGNIASSKGIKLIIEYPENIMVNSDYQLLERAVEQIVDNAIKFTPSGSVTFRSETIFENDQELLQLSVLDTGIGIAIEQHQLVLQEFRQASEGFDRNYEGMGLGLSLAKKITEKLGGTLNLISQPFQGTEVLITIPINQEAKKLKADTTDYQDLLMHLIETKKARPSFLIVEDNPTTTDLLKMYLENYGNCDIASQGTEALAKIKSKHYDSIILDINLGEEPDGMKVAENIKKSPKNSNTPLIAVTGYASDEDREIIIGSGFDVYIPKPFQQKQILKAIYDTLNLHKKK